MLGWLTAAGAAYLLWLGLTTIRTWRGASFFVLLVAVVYSVVALLARRLLHSRPGAARKVTLASGIIMVALGAVLLSEQLVPLLGQSLSFG